jgi:hypothetical protein
MISIIKADFMGGSKLKMRRVNPAHALNNREG